MIKDSPNPPETDDVSPYQSLDSKKLHAAAHRALDHYLTPPGNRHALPDRRPGTIFMIVPGVESESLLAHACETLASANVMASDLAFDLTGPACNMALAIQQMISLAQLSVNRVLDQLDPPDSAE
ncbi:DUF6124 family protein [Pseudomonas purpurea]|uniref:DUF6124 family protein n=1 Tax=Pseudomonas purpurea TaxID=3136737 RepID=UPI003266B8E6